MFGSLETRPADAILKLIAEFREDQRSDKIDLGVGVYRDADGNTPIFRSVKAAEQWLIKTQDSKAYLGSRGAVDFCEAIQKMVFADSVADERLYTLQTPGGSGALRVAAELIHSAFPAARVWVSTPSWPNHVPLFSEVGLGIAQYPYYDAESRTLQFSAMLEALEQAQKGELLLLHGCCHNPSGMDLDDEQWKVLTELVLRRGLIPFVDIAYQGLASGIDKDVSGMRYMAARVPEMIVAHSCSKNFGLYRDRVGSISILAENTSDVKDLSVQLPSIVRTLYSIPPDHGAAVVTKILQEDELRADWLQELGTMRDRLTAMRSRLVEALAETAPGHDFSQLQRSTGMFCFLGLSAAQTAQIKRDHGVYMLDSSRINVCGITEHNVDRLAEAVGKVL